MNILYCGDVGITRGVLVSILSLMMNGDKHNDEKQKHNMAINRGEKKHDRASEEYNIYIATINHGETVGFSEHSVKFLDGLVKKYNPRNSVRLIDATEAFLRDLPERNMGSYFTPCSMLRLYIDKMPELGQLERILYLDYDVVCRGDLRDFYYTDLAEVEAAGVLDIYGRRWYHYHGLVGELERPAVVDARSESEKTRTLLRQDYMNSGVMLFNLPECFKAQVFLRARKYCQEKWMLLADQAALNKAVGRRKLMPRKYNEQEEKPREDTVLHHFSNNFKFWPYFRVQKVKPYEVDKVHKVLKITEYDDILEEYLRLQNKI